MLRRLKRSLSLRPVDFVVALRAYAYLIRSAWIIFIKREPTRSVRNRIDSAAPSDDSLSAQDFNYERAALWINRVSRVPFPWARCYQRSVALSMWMSSRGLKPDLKFGARRTEKGIDAHSWVEYGGEVINDSPNVREVFGTFTQADAPEAEAGAPGRGQK